MTQIYSCDQVEPPTPSWSFFFTNCEPSIDVNDKIEGIGSLLLSPLGVAWESRFQIVFNPPYREDWSTKLGIQLGEKVEATGYPIKIMIFAPDYANRLEITISPNAADFWETPSILFNEMTSYGAPNLADVSSLDIWLIRQEQMVWFKLDDIRTIDEAPPPPPPEHVLTVDSLPINGIPFTIDIGGISTELVTPWSGPLAEGSYIIKMASNVPNYKFDRYEDGSTDPTRTINLTADKSIMSTYELISIINGKVIDAKTEQPIIGALVECNGKQTSTDELGNYTFNNLSANIYTVVVSAAGYTGQTIEVDASAGGTFTQDFSLTLSPLPLNKTALAVGAAFVAAVVTALIYIRLKKKSY